MYNRTPSLNTFKIALLPAFVLATLVAGLALMAVSISQAVAGGSYKDPTAQADIVETAVAAGDFNTLITAVQAAGLVDTLKGEGPLTVFAPTDEAFAKIPPETLTRLLQDKQALTQVLTYHVIPGKVMAADVIRLESATTVQGQPVDIETSAEGVTVDNAKVVKADIETSNGVIHAIDTVMMPKS